MATQTLSYQVVARNFSDSHENKMHSDEVAKRFGFRGALVPGVAVYGHLTHPLVSHYGDNWLGHSVHSVRFLKPAYHGDTLDITLSENSAGCAIQCKNQLGELLAELHTKAIAEMPALEDQQLFTQQPHRQEPGDGRDEISWDNVSPLQPFEPWQWQISAVGNAEHAAQISDEHATYSANAHPHWIQSMANRALTRQYMMPAWIHVGSEMRFHKTLKVDDHVTINAIPLEKWQKKGHEFIRVYLAYSRDNQVTTEIFHTAIFNVAG